MKVIIQIPCLNESGTLPAVIRGIPRKIDRVDTVEVLVIDDGSSDGTSDVARAGGADHIIRFNRTVGLARAFKAGIEKSAELGADITVNTDGDNQYDSSCIPDIIRPILDGRADIAIGARRVSEQGPVKAFLQWLGSALVSKLSGMRITDATSGFRAFSRNAVAQLNIMSDFSYTLESIIQAGAKGLVVMNVPVKTNRPSRESRLYRNNLHYIKRSLGTIVKVYVSYEGFRVFFASGAFFVLAGIALICRYLYFYILGVNPSGHIQSLIAAAILVITGFLAVALGIITELACGTRRIAEETLARMKKLESEKNSGNK